LNRCRLVLDVTSTGVASVAGAIVVRVSTFGSELSL
jgi:hypothetical protein